mgnify:CR=1 FL=1
MLNRVRTRWEVSEIKVNHEIEDNKRILRISWEEKGKATNKAIAVWDIHSNTKFFDIELGSDTREVVVVKSLENFPDGDYRIQFYELDIWGTTVAIMPESGEDNTADVQIGVFVETIDNVIKHGIRLAFLTDDKNKNLYCAFPSPLIKDIQPIKGTEIETEYQGWFYHVNTDGLLSPILTNPVRFIINIEDRSLPYLLDCDNDGAAGKGDGTRTDLDDDGLVGINSQQMGYRLKYNEVFAGQDYLTTDTALGYVGSINYPNSAQMTSAADIVNQDHLDVIGVGPDMFDEMEFYAAVFDYIAYYD